MSSRTNITIPKYVREQVDELVESGVVTTLASAVNLGLLMLINKHKFQRWDDDLFKEYKSSLLSQDRESKVLLSRQFQQDLNKIVKEISGMRRIVKLTFKRLVNHFYSGRKLSVFTDNSLEIKKLDTKNYFYADFIFKGNNLRILLRQQQENLIVGRIGFTADFLV